MHIWLCLFRTFSAQRVAIFPEHKSFVQGVAFDPEHQFVATMSSDRLVQYYYRLYWKLIEYSAHVIMVMGLLTFCCKPCPNINRYGLNITIWPLIYIRSSLGRPSCQKLRSMVKQFKQEHVNRWIHTQTLPNLLIILLFFLRSSAAKEQYQKFL